MAYILAHVITPRNHGVRRAYPMFFSSASLQQIYGCLQQPSHGDWKSFFFFSDICCNFFHCRVPARVCVTTSQYYSSSFASWKLVNGSSFWLFQ